MITKAPVTAAIVAVVGALSLGVANTADAQLKRITIGTNPQGSTYFLLGSGFAKLFQETLEIRSTAQPHAGSSVYLPLMQAGEISLGVNSSLDSGMAWNAVEPYKEAMKKVRSIARVWILPYGYMVKEDSGIRTIGDLKGKRVVIDFKTNVSLGQLNRTIMSTAGLSTGDITPIESGGVVASINMVVQGRVDAAPVATGMPAMRKAHASVPGGLRIIALGPKASDEYMNNGMPGSYTLLARNSKRTPFIREDTRIAAFDSYLNAGSNVGDEDAYRMAKALYENWEQLQQDYPPLRGTPQKGLAPANNPIPYHPGAAKYYKEVGLYTDANMKNDSMQMKK